MSGVKRKEGWDRHPFLFHTYMRRTPKTSLVWEREKGLRRSPERVRLEGVLGPGPKDDINYLCICVSQLKRTFSAKSDKKIDVILYVLYPYAEHMYGPRPLPAGTTY